METADTFAPGEILGGKYRVVRALGEGGMAIVYEAVHAKLGHRVALKVLREVTAASSSLVARFEREGRALSQLRSPNVVRVFDVDTTARGIPYLVMEYLEGGDIEMELRRRGPLPIGEAVHYTLQACSAMQEAHSLGIVHRDIKPTNLFLATEGTARVLKVLDFGIASQGTASEEVRLTKTESVMGTPLYMAPEQFRSGKDADARTDVWGLGATLYEMLTGAAPFTGSPTTIGVAIVNDDARPIEATRPDVPSPLRDVVPRALRKDPAERFPTMQAFADALRPFGEGVVIASRSSAQSFPDVAGVGGAKTLLRESGPTDTSAPTMDATLSAARPAVTQPEAALQRKRVTKWVVAAAGAAVLVGVGALAVKGERAPRKSPPSAQAALPSMPAVQPSTAVSASDGPTAASAVVSDASAVPQRKIPVHPSGGPARAAGAGPSASSRTALPDPSSHPLFFPQ